MTPNLATILYLPPESPFYTSACLQNLAENPAKHPLVTFSENPSFKPTLLLKRSPELPELAEVRHSHNGVAYGTNNLCFFLAWAFAWKLGLTHFIYGEVDIRVRNRDAAKKWDEEIFEQYFGDTRQLMIGGSMALYNCFNADRVTAQRASDLMTKWNTNLNGDTRERNRFLPHYGSRSASAADGTCVLCIGAGAVYSVDALKILFPELQDPDDNGAKIALARDVGPFDFAIGKRIFERFKADAFDVVGHLPVMFSAYGDVLSSLDERLAMLRSGEVCLIHQVKSDVVN